MVFMVLAGLAMALVFFIRCLAQPDEPSFKFLVPIGLFLIFVGLGADLVVVWVPALIVFGVARALDYRWRALNGSNRWLF
ncbi:MAG: hypothetical protein EPO13_00470 [Actinomycetota bacterium]|nr:MAG: hypothetical protein EPO13_00470 [Actinomycetota bacterium]